MHVFLFEWFPVQVVFRSASYSIMSIEIKINYFISIVDFKILVVRFGNDIALEPYKMMTIFHIWLCDRPRSYR